MSVCLPASSDGLSEASTGVAGRHSAGVAAAFTIQLS